MDEYRTQLCQRFSSDQGARTRWLGWRTRRQLTRPPGSPAERHQKDRTADDLLTKQAGRVYVLVSLSDAEMKHRSCHSHKVSTQNPSSYGHLDRGQV